MIKKYSPLLYEHYCSGDIMNKSAVVEALTKNLNLSTDITSSIVSTILGAMTETMVRGENVEIRGFGSFAVREYTAHTCKNPKTGEATEVKARKSPFFKVGKELREAVDDQKNCKINILSEKLIVSQKSC